MLVVIATPGGGHRSAPAIDGCEIVMVEPDGSGSGQHAFHTGRSSTWRSFVVSCSNRELQPWVAVHTPDQVHAAVEIGANLWLRGSECGGSVNSVSVLILLRAAHGTGVPFLVEGLGHRGFAAALAVGAAGLVLDAHTWELDDTPLLPEHRALLNGRTGRDTHDPTGRRLGPPVLPGWWTRPESGVPAPQSIADRPTSGTLANWLPGFIDAIQARQRRAASTELLGCDPLGTGRPIVQGPMANVSENAVLAQSVIQSGGLPFCALGALRPADAEAVLSKMHTLEGRWGAGVIGFEVMPHRDAHLQALPGGIPVILAGGSPALATQLTDRGLDPWLHTPSARLAERAIRRGVRTLVLEGREAGGHVGTLTSAGLWEETLAAVEAHTTNVMLVLAGGIGDAVSAAFAASMADGAYRNGHQIALQMGTAFLLTHEIVEAKQITSTYQQAALACTKTTLVGQTVNLPLRCTPNNFTKQVYKLEQDQIEQPLRLRREQLEHFNLGRTRIAAKGIQRDGSGGYRRLPTKQQIDLGAFTMGAGAIPTHALQTVEELLQSVTTGAADLLRARAARLTPWGPVEEVVPDSMPIDEVVQTPTTVRTADIAVVGLGCVLPGAPDVAAFLALLRDGIDAIQPVPASRWSAGRYFDPTPQSSSTRSYVRMAGVVDGPAFDPVVFGIPPAVVPSMDRAQILALIAARQAMQGVQIHNRRRAAVVLGNSMGGEHAKSLAVRVRHREVLAALGELGDPVIEARVEAALEATLPPVDVEAMSGLLANVIAGRVASWLDLMGGNLTVDAACAASLAATTTAIDWLRAGRCDVVLTGGVDADLSPETFVGFCRTHALSHHGAKPFSTGADGFVMGEGAAVFVLKRMKDALADGDTVHAIIRGVGVASDGRSSGITAPNQEGQVLAIRRAWADADVQAETIDLIEAHGTGTALGDRTEFEALGRAFGSAQTPWVGSVKSQIGHLKGAAGAAGMLKTVLSLKHQIVFPTLHPEPPIQAANRFRLPQTAMRLPDQAVAGVSAFGFGGTNFHLVLQAHASEPLPIRSQQGGAAVVLRTYRGDTRAQVAERLEAGHNCTPDELIQRSVRLVVLGEPEGVTEWVRSGGSGSFAQQAWLAEGAIREPVWVFPGQGSPRDGAFEAITQLPAAAAFFDRLQIEHLDTSADPAAQHHLLVALGCAWSQVLEDVPVAGVIGHSVGELAALVAAGRLRASDALTLAAARGKALVACAPGGMVAVSVPEADALAMLPHLNVAAVNSPSSTVMAGPLDALAQTVFPDGLRYQRLDVERAFHTATVQPAENALREALQTVSITPGKPWWSNVPGNGSAAERLAQAITAPVRFMESLQRANDAGHTLFLHIGPGSALSRHIERTLVRATVIDLQPERAPDLSDVVRAAAALLAEGHPGLLSSLPGRLVVQPFPQEPPVRPVPTRHGLPSDQVAALRTAARSLLDALGEPAVLPPPEPPPEPAVAPTKHPNAPDDVRSAVLQSIGAITGYPESALRGDARLDTDLGIDSIRKLEIVGLVQDKLGVVIDETALAAQGALDLDGLVAWLEQDQTTKVQPDLGDPHLWRVAVLPSASKNPIDETMLPRLIAALAKGPTALDPAQPSHHAARRFDDIVAVESSRSPHARGLGTEVPALPNAPTPLPDAPVFLATGGTTGIVAHCLSAVPGARGVVLGRRETGQLPGFTYLSCDITDAAAVDAAAAQCRTLFGRIDVVLHGAGVLRDRPHDTLTSEDLDAVLAPKVTGAKNLIQATLQDTPRWVVFSSIAGPLGNPGQAAYAAANAWLEHLTHPTSRHSTAIRWSAWTEIGMARDPGLQRLLRARGIHALTPTEGAGLFHRALQHTGTLWAAHTPPPTEALPWPLTGATGSGYTLQLDPTDPLLIDHQVAGAALVPGAWWVSAMVAAARCQHPTCSSWTIESFEIVAPTIVRRPLQVELRCGDGWEIRRAGHILARGRVQPSSPTPMASAPSPFEPTGTASYTPDQLFHGPSWQMLGAVHLASGSAAAELTINGVDPLATLVDAAHQLLATWAGHTTGRMGLPVGAARWSVVDLTGGGILRLEIDANAADGRILGDVRVIDTDGRVVLRGENVELRTSSRWGTDA